MKKVGLILAVLAIAPLANATYQISAVQSGANWTLGVDLTDLTGVKDAAFALVVKTTEGTITGGARGTGADDATAINGPALPDLAGIIPDGTDGIYGLIGTYGVYAAGNYVQNATFSFKPGQGSATIQMYTITESGASLEATKVIPEPITMGLLGLGGLFLRRRLA